MPGNAELVDARSSPPRQPRVKHDCVEVIAGFRGKGQSVYVYYAQDARGSQWDRQVLDNGGIAASACAVADLNGDGRPDLACIGADKLKWYENLGGGTPARQTARR